MKTRLIYPVYEIKNIIEGSNQDYIAQSRRNKFYQIAFMAFGFLFALLGGLVFFGTTNWGSALHFNHSELIKASTYIFCFLLSLSSIGLSCSLRPEFEVLENMAKIFENNLDRIYRDLQQLYPDHTLFQEFYEHSLKKIESKKKRATEKLNLIKQSSTLDKKTKSELNYETLYELQNKLKQVLYRFRNEMLLIIT